VTHTSHTHTNTTQKAGNRAGEAQALRPVDAAAAPKKGEEAQDWKSGIVKSLQQGQVCVCVCVCVCVRVLIISHASVPFSCSPQTHSAAAETSSLPATPKS
jgi:hypothetical protein